MVCLNSKEDKKEIGRKWK